MTTGLQSRNLSFSEVAFLSGSIPLIEPAWSSVPNAATGNLTVRLRTSDLVVEQASRPIVVDWQSGMPYLLSQKLTTTGTGAFTEADRVVMKQSMALSALNLGAWLPEIIGALEEAVPLGDTSSRITPDRTGAGELTRPFAWYGVYAQGIRYEVIPPYPAGYGIDEGAPRSFNLPVVEIGLVRDVQDGSDVTMDSHWYHDMTGEWWWMANMPSKVLYWITPGVTLRFWWILFPLELPAPAALSA